MHYVQFWFDDAFEEIIVGDAALVVMDNHLLIDVFQNWVFQGVLLGLFNVVVSFAVLWRGPVEHVPSVP